MLVSGFKAAGGQAIAPGSVLCGFGTFRACPIPALFLVDREQVAATLLDGAVDNRLSQVEFIHLCYGRDEILWRDVLRYR